jgi:hypothetical protein
MKKSKSVATHIRTLSLLILIGALNNNSSAEPGDVDLSFDPESGVNGTVNAAVVKPDGKVIIGGQFTMVKGLLRTNLARLNADGSGDSTFTAAPQNNPVYSLALQTDGKVLVGSVKGFNFGLTRVNTDGSADTNFNANVYAAILTNPPYYGHKLPPSSCNRMARCSTPAKLCSDSTRTELSTPTSTPPPLPSFIRWRGSPTAS